MNFTELFALIWQNRTKALGFVQVTIGVLATANGLFSETALKWIILCSGLTTAWLGFFNSSHNRPDPTDEAGA